MVGPPRVLEDITDCVEFRAVEVFDLLYSEHILEGIRLVGVIRP